MIAEKQPQFNPSYRTGVRGNAQGTRRNGTGEEHRGSKVVHPERGLPIRLENPSRVMKTRKPILLIAALGVLSAAGAVCAFGQADPVDVRLTPSKAEILPGESFTLNVVFTIAAPYHIYGPAEKMGTKTAVKMQPAQGLVFAKSQFPKPKTKNLPDLGGEYQLYQGKVTVVIPASVQEAAKAGKREIVALVSYGACDDKSCLVPVTDRKVSTSIVVKPPKGQGGLEGAGTPSQPGQAGGTGAAVGEAHPAATGEGGGQAQGVGQSSPAAEQHGAKGSAGSAKESEEPLRSALARGLVVALVMSFGWGVLGSLTPCVYPMIPVTIGVFAAQSKAGASRRRTIALALVYVLGITICYTALGIGVALAGHDVGEFMVNPWVVGVIVAVFSALALSMFGLYEIQLPSSVMGKLSTAGGHGFIGALLMGLVLGFVAAPCVGPFAASILAYIATKGSVIIGALSLFCFGLGLGMLFLVVAISAGSISSLPKSGEWMVTIERGAGFLLLVMALYFLSNVVGPHVVALLGAVLAFAFAAWAGAFTALARDDGFGRKVGKTIGVIAAVLGAYLLFGVLAQRGFVIGPLSGPPREAEAERLWETYLDDGLARAAREGKPVFADFRADWCIPCKQMERQVLVDPEVEAKLAEFVLIRLDCTDPGNPNLKLKTQGFGSKAMPFLAFWSAEDAANPAKRLKPTRFHHGYMHKEEFLEMLQEVTKS
jgi:thiol:disulfide interchange protein DsbD